MTWGNMKRLFRRWKWILAVVVLLPLVLLGVGQWMLSAQLAPEALVQRLESKFNCRAEVKAATGSIWSHPAKVQLTGLTLLPRDADADNARPLSERQPLDFASQATGLFIDNASLEVSLWQLLTGDLAVEDLTVNVVTLRTNTTQDGVNSLRTMLQRPATVAGKPNPAPSAAKAVSPKKPSGEKEASKPVHVGDLPLASLLKAARINHVRMDIRSEKRKEMLRLEDATIALDDIRVDPAELASSNHAKFGLTGKFQVIGKRRMMYADVGMTLSGDFSPFDAATGELGSIPLSLDLQPGSTLKEVAALQRISQKMKRWEKYGLKFRPLPADVELKDGARLDFDFRQGKFNSRGDFALALDNYDVVLAKGAALNLNDDECLMEIRITASKPVSEQTVRDFESSLREKYSAVGEVLFSTVMKLFRENNLVLPDGRLSVPMGLSGSIQKPEVEDRVTPLLEKALLQSLIPTPN